MIEWTPAGTVRCIYCKAEWIGTPDGDHDDPCCMMWVMRWDHLPNEASQGSVPDHDDERRAAST